MDSANCSIRASISVDKIGARALLGHSPGLLPRGAMLFLLITLVGCWPGVGLVQNADTYQAYALLQISRVPPRLMLRGSVPPMDPAEFETFKRTQATLVTSNSVMRRALEHDDDALSESVRLQILDTNWVADHVTVDFPGDSEVMRIGVTMTDASHSTLLVNAIAGAYLADALEAEQREQKYVHELLVRKYTEKQQMLQDKFVALQAILVKSGGASNPSEEFVNRDKLAQLQVEQSQLRLALVGTKRNLLRAESKVDQVSDAGSDFVAAIEELKLAEDEHELVRRRLKSVTSAIGETVRPSSPEATMEVENQRAEIDQLRRATNDIGVKLQLLELEHAAPPRVTLIESARLP